MSRFRMWFGFAAVALLAMPAAAEVLRTQGTFRGFYHENRAGVGHFHYFIVHKDLRKDLAPYEGQYIELDVLAGHQRMSPGPAILTRIGNVRELGEAPLKVTIKALAPAWGGPDTFDLLYSFRNTSDQPVTLDTSLVSIGLLGPRDAGGNPDKVDDFFDTGYTRGQMAYGGQSTQHWNFIGGVISRARTHFYVGNVQLDPGEEVPFIWLGVPNQGGVREVVVSAMCVTPAEERRPIMSWTPLDLPAPLQPATDEGLKIVATVTRGDEWLNVDARLINDTGEPRHIFVRPDGERYLVSGIAQLEADDGNPLTTDVVADEPSAPWEQKPIDENGLRFGFRVRQIDRFSQAAEKGLAFWTLTAGGMQRLTVAKELPPAELQPEPPWGEVSLGARLRIRPMKRAFRVSEQVRIYYQMESDGSQADILRINKGNFESHVRAELDGQPVRLHKTGLSEGSAPRFPFQGHIDLADGLNPGNYRLRLTVHGDAGTHTNLKGETFRQFGGTLVSNEIVFSVAEE